MRSIRVRRVASVSAAGLAALLSVGATTVPAQASTMKLALFVAPSVQLPTTPVAQPPRSGGNLFIDAGRIGQDSPQNAQLTVDTTRLAGIADLGLPQGCTAKGRVYTCPEWNLDFPRINLTQNFWLSTAKGAKPGAHGTLHITLTASNAQSASADVRVDVGGPDLKVKQLPWPQPVKVGATVSPAIEFANLGSLPTSKIYVQLTTDPGLDYKRRPSNCEYATEPGDKTWPGEADAICTINAVVAPGETYRIDPLQFGVSASAYYSYSDISLLAKDDAQFSGIPAWRNRLHFVRGTAPAVTAHKIQDPSVAAGPRRSYDNRTMLAIQADNTADFAAVGAWVPDASGTHGTLTIGAANHGPASIEDRSGGDGMPSVRMTVPDGATVTSIPANCSAVTWENGKQVAHPNKYECRAFGGSWAATGTKSLFAFGLKLTNASVKAVAPISLQNEASLYGKGHPTAVMPWDHNPSNDATTVVLSSKPSGSL